MFIIFFLRWLRGHIRFSARSGSIERFINLCAYHHIPSWECRRSDGTFSGCTTVSGYRRMHRLARKAGVVTRVTERYGLPFLIHRYRKRLGILIGVLFFALFLTVMQQFIWVIRIEGNEQIDSRILTNALADLGVHRGSFKGRIDAGVLREELVIRVDGLAWAALNIRGTTATLLVRERVRPPEKIDTDVPANVVAARDGQIKRLEVTDGRALLRVGDTVREGEIIVSGVNEDRWGMTHLVRANARVIAHIPESLKIEVPLVQEEYVLTGEIKKRRYLELFGVRLPLFLYRGLEGDYKLERITRSPKLFGLELPFLITRENYLFYETRLEEISPESALRIAERALRRQETENWGDTILSADRSAEVVDGMLCLTGRYLIEQDIARQVEIPVFDKQEQKKTSHKREGGY